MASAMTKAAAVSIYQDYWHTLKNILPFKHTAEEAMILETLLNDVYTSLTAIDTDGSYNIALTEPRATITPYSSGTRPYKIVSGGAISYTIETTGGENTNVPIVFSASYLPGWLTLNSSTGTLTGTAPAISSSTLNSNTGARTPNNFDIPEMATMISAVNGFGQAVNGPYPFVFEVVNSASPVPSSVATLNVAVGGAFNYTILASNTPSAFIAYDLAQFNAGATPGTVSLNTGTGVISGNLGSSTGALAAGTYTFYIAASNTVGEGVDRAVVVTIGNVPVVTSGAAATGIHNGAMTEYDIVATNTPTSYAATGLAALNAGATAGSVVCNAGTGKITGNCGSGAGSAGAGTYVIGVTATNVFGTSVNHVVTVTLS